jgi:hypothetical protein
MPYRLVLNEDAARFLVQASRPAQRRLNVVLDDLKTSPFRSGDLQELDEEGRENEILAIGNWMVTYWTDHAAREIRVTRLESTDEGRCPAPTGGRERRQILHFALAGRERRPPAIGMCSPECLVDTGSTA